MKLITNLEIIKRAGERNRDANFDFRAKLKMKDSEWLDRIVHEIYKDVVKQIDCLECANCCCNLTPKLSEEEIEIYCIQQGISFEEFVEENIDSEILKEDDKYYLKAQPCMFLEGKKCTIYEERPEDCRSYPHLHKEDFNSRTWVAIDNYEVCPIVYNTFERLKGRLNFR